MTIKTNIVSPFDREIEAVQISQALPPPRKTAA
jgi:hypothetical protein